jgi:hypothetical protein
MSKQRHRRRSQGETTPETTPQTGSEVAHFSVSEVVQFWMSVDSWVIKSDYGKPNRNNSTVIRSWDLAAALAAKGAASNNGASSRPLQPQLHY